MFLDYNDLNANARLSIPKKYTISENNVITE